ncbi:hypothetical protein FKM82_011888 [Ascaphus truei]
MQHPLTFPHLPTPLVYTPTPHLPFVKSCIHCGCFINLYLHIYIHTHIHTHSYITNIQGPFNISSHKSQTAQV